VNERWQKYTTGNYGNQYRSGLPNADGTIWLSGEKGNAPADFNPITKFQIDKKVSAWVKTEGGKQTGYVIIMGVPWVHYNNDLDTEEGTEGRPNPNFNQPNDNKVFDADGKVIEGAEIGLELQVNACQAATGGSSSRNGILTWNGVTSQAYQNVKSFGIVTLKTGK